MVSGLVKKGLMVKLVKSVDVVQPVSQSDPTQRVGQRKSPQKYPKKRHRKRQDHLKLIGQQQHQEEKEHNYEI